MTDSKRASWVALYANSLREATHILPDKEFKVLLFLVSFINAQGNCFPAIKDIAAELDLKGDDVIKLLESLEARRYITFLRRNARDPYTGQFQPNVYGLAFNFIALTPENEIVARQLRDVLPPIPNLGSTSESYTTNGLNSFKPPVVNHRQEPPPPPPPSDFASESETAESWPQTIEQSRLDGDEGKDEKQEQNHQREAQPARNAQGGLPTPSSAAPPPSRRYSKEAGEPFGEPFATEWDDLNMPKEQTAVEVAQAVNTRMKIARWLIDPYPVEVVKAALMDLRREMEKGRCKSPFGLLKTWLERGDYTQEHKL